MEIVIIILLAVLVVFFLWDRLRAGQRWKEQSDALYLLSNGNTDGNKKNVVVLKFCERFPDLTM